MASDKDVISEAKEAFQLASDNESENREEALSDLRFLKLNEHWPDQVKTDRDRENRPCLTIPLLPAFVRQVTNDARQNVPTIKVHPVDSQGDVKTAQVYDGLIRNIEQISNADVAYDTAIDFAVSCGFGYHRVNIDYAHDDTFDKDILIQRIANPFNVYADPYSTSADGSDWMTAFIVDQMSKDAFEATYKGAEAVNWEDDGYNKQGLPWVTDDSVMVAEYWTRSEVMRPVVKLNNGEIILASEWKDNQDLWMTAGLSVVGERAIRSWKVNQKIMTCAEVLKDNDWAGCYIPIIPTYGEEINIEGKRIFKSLIRDAKDAQRQFNYWRTAATELVALAPKTPFIGPEVAFQGEDQKKWDTANLKNWSYISYKGNVPPQRQQFAGPAGGAMQEALSAHDDIKAITGLYDASLGQRSNETSGKAINARKVEGETSTFHFVDNQVRAVRQTGKILIDLIPKVYTGDRMVRVLGRDGSVQNVQLGEKPQQPQMPPQVGQTPMQAPGMPQLPGAAQQAPNALPGQMQALSPAGTPQEASSTTELTGVFDLSAGKYDLTVTAGPSYTTQRQEAADQMMQLLQAFPQAAPYIGDLVAKNLDWPGADEIAARLKAIVPQPGGPDPQAMQQMQEQLQQMGQQMQMGMQKFQQLQQENQQLQQQLALAKLDQQNTAAKISVDSQKNQTEAYKAETERLQAQAEAQRAAAEAQAIHVNTQQNVDVSGAVNQLAATTAAIHQHLAMQSQPKVKRAMKQPDGSWAMTEEPAVMQ